MVSKWCKERHNAHRFYDNGTKINSTGVDQLPKRLASIAYRLGSFVAGGLMVSFACFLCAMAPFVLLAQVVDINELPSVLAAFVVVTSFCLSTALLKILFKFLQ